MRPRARGVGWHVLVARGFAEEHRSVGEWHEGLIKACPRGAEVSGEGVRFVVQLVVGDVLLVVVGIRDGAVGDARCRCARRVLRAVQSREPDVRREAEAGDRVCGRISHESEPKRFHHVVVEGVGRRRRLDVQRDVVLALRHHIRRAHEARRLIQSIVRDGHAEDAHEGRRAGPCALHRRRQSFKVLLGHVGHHRQDATVGG